MSYQPSQLQGPTRHLARRLRLLTRRRSNARLARSDALLARERERLHEVRAALSSVLAARDVLTGNRRQALSTTVRHRLERLQAFELSRIERLLGEDLDDPVVPIDLGRVLDPVVDSFRLRGHAVRWAGTERRAVGRADDVADVAHILLDNATRHGGGSSVALDIGTRGNWFEVRVSDEGPGVPPTLADSLFDRGTQAPGSSGQGLGLHIARRLARGLGDDLRLESPAQKGAAFTFRLPRHTGVAPCLAPAV